MNNIGISISFIIGGLLIVSILTLNSRVIQNSGETVLDMSAKRKVETIGSIISRDFKRIGYNMKNKSKKPIQSVSSDKIIFWADVDNDKSTYAKKIIWRFNKPGNPANSTENPNDYELTRIVSGSTSKSTFPIVGFELSYFDKDDNSTSDPGEIRTIRISVESQAPASYDKNSYSISTWDKYITPPNLKLQDIEW